MADWDRLPPGMKKPWGYKEALVVHAACGGYITIMSALQASVPQADYEAHEAQIREQFNLSYLDADIIHLLETTVPPVNLSDVNFVRTVSRGGFYHLSFENFGPYHFESLGSHCFYDVSNLWAPFRLCPTDRFQEHCQQCGRPQPTRE